MHERLVLQPYYGYRMTMQTYVTEGQIPQQLALADNNRNFLF